MVLWGRRWGTGSEGGGDETISHVGDGEQEKDGGERGQDSDEGDKREHGHVRRRHLDMTHSPALERNPLTDGTLPSTLNPGLSIFDAAAREQSLVWDGQRRW